MYNQSQLNALESRLSVQKDPNQSMLSSNVAGKLQNIGNNTTQLTMSLDRQNSGTVNQLQILNKTAISQLTALNEIQSILSSGLQQINTSLLQSGGAAAAITASSQMQGRRATTGYSQAKDTALDDKVAKKYNVKSSLANLVRIPASLLLQKYDTWEDKTLAMQAGSFDVLRNLLKNDIERNKQNIASGKVKNKNIDKDGLDDIKLTMRESLKKIPGFGTAIANTAAVAVTALDTAIAPLKSGFFRMKLNKMKSALGLTNYTSTGEVLKKINVRGADAQERAYDFLGDEFPRYLEDARIRDYEKIELLKDISENMSRTATTITGKERAFNDSLYANQKVKQVYDPSSGEYVSKEQFNERQARIQQLLTDKLDSEAGMMGAFLGPRIKTIVENSEYLSKAVGPIHTSASTAANAAYSLGNMTKAESASQLSTAKYELEKENVDTAAMLSRLTTFAPLAIAGAAAAFGAPIAIASAPAIAGLTALGTILSSISAGWFGRMNKTEVKEGNDGMNESGVFNNSDYINSDLFNTRFKLDDFIEQEKLLNVDERENQHIMEEAKKQATIKYNAAIRDGSLGNRTEESFITAEQNAARTTDYVDRQTRADAFARDNDVRAAKKRDAIIDRFKNDNTLSRQDLIDYYLRLETEKTPTMSNSELNLARTRAITQADQIAQDINSEATNLTNVNYQAKEAARINIEADTFTDVSPGSSTNPLFGGVLNLRLVSSLMNPKSMQPRLAWSVLKDPNNAGIFAQIQIRNAITSLQTILTDFATNLRSDIDLLPTAIALELLPFLDPIGNGKLAKDISTAIGSTAVPVVDIYARSLDAANSASFLPLNADLQNQLRQINTVIAAKQGINELPISELEGKVLQTGEQGVEQFAVNNGKLSVIPNPKTVIDAVQDAISNDNSVTNMIEETAAQQLEKSDEQLTIFQKIYNALNKKAKSKSVGDMVADDQAASAAENDKNSLSSKLTDGFKNLQKSLGSKLDGLNDKGKEKVETGIGAMVLAGIASYAYDVITDLFEQSKSGKDVNIFGTLVKNLFTVSGGSGLMANLGAASKYALIGWGVGSVAGLFGGPLGIIGGGVAGAVIGAGLGMVINNIVGTFKESRAEGNGIFSSLVTALFSVDGDSPFAAAGKYALIGAGIGATVGVAGGPLGIMGSSIAGAVLGSGVGIIVNSMVDIFKESRTNGDGIFTSIFKSIFASDGLAGMGKYAVYGAGIGGLAFPVIGAIPGAILGAGVGYIIESVTDIFKESRTNGDGIFTSIFKSIFASDGLAGMGKYAVYGAGIGTAFFPVVGTIGGAILGAGVGLVVDAMTRIFSSGDEEKAPSMFSSIFNSIFDTVSGYAATGMTWGSSVVSKIAGAIMGSSVGHIITSLSELLEAGDISGFTSKLWNLPKETLDGMKLGKYANKLAMEYSTYGWYPGMVLGIIHGSVADGMVNVFEFVTGKDSKDTIKNVKDFLFKNPKQLAKDHLTGKYSQSLSIAWSDKFSYIGMLAGGIVGSIGDAIMSVVDWISDLEPFKMIKEFLSEKIDAMMPWNWFDDDKDNKDIPEDQKKKKSIWKRTKDAASSAYNKVKEVAGNVGDSAAVGFQSALKTAKQGVGEVADWGQKTASEVSNVAESGYKAVKTGVQVGAETGSVGAGVAAGKAAYKINRKFKDKSEFVNTMQPVADKVGKELGVDPQIILAQMATESAGGTKTTSGWGNSGLTSKGNNFFGMKIGTTKGINDGAIEMNTGEFDKTGKHYMMKDKFAKFKDTDQMADSYIAYVKRKYPNAVGKGDDAEGYLSELSKGGYATNPNYVSDIIGVMGTIGKVERDPSKNIYIDQLETAQADPEVPVADPSLVAPPQPSLVKNGDVQRGNKTEEDILASTKYTSGIPMLFSNVISDISSPIEPAQLPAQPKLVRVGRGKRKETTKVAPPTVTPKYTPMLPTLATSATPILSSELINDVPWTKAANDKTFADMAKSTTTYTPAPVTVAYKEQKDDSSFDFNKLIGIGNAYGADEVPQQETEYMRNARLAGEAERAGQTTEQYKPNEDRTKQLGNTFNQKPFVTIPKVDDGTNKLARMLTATKPNNSIIPTSVSINNLTNQGGNIPDGWFQEDDGMYSERGSGSQDRGMYEDYRGNVSKSMMLEAIKSDKLSNFRESNLPPGYVKNDEGKIIREGDDVFFGSNETFSDNNQAWYNLEKNDKEAFDKTMASVGGVEPTKPITTEPSKPVVSSPVAMMDKADAKSREVEIDKTNDYDRAKIDNANIDIRAYNDSSSRTDDVNHTNTNKPVISSPVATITTPKVRADASKFSKEEQLFFSDYDENGHIKLNSSKLFGGIVKGLSSKTAAYSQGKDGNYYDNLGNATDEFGELTEIKMLKTDPITNQRYNELGEKVDDRDNVISSNSPVNNINSNSNSTPYTYSGESVNTSFGDNSSGLYNGVGGMLGQTVGASGGVSGILKNGISGVSNILSGGTSGLLGKIGGLFGVDSFPNNNTNIKSGFGRTGGYLSQEAASNITLNNTIERDDSLFEQSDNKGEVITTTLAPQSNITNNVMPIASQRKATTGDTSSNKPFAIETNFDEYLKEMFASSPGNYKRSVENYAVKGDKIMFG